MRATVHRPQPLARAPWGRIRAVFSDVDGTLTTGGELLGSTVAALARLRDAGIRVVLVTGRPSGWGECWARTLPVDGVIAENGGLYFARRARTLAKVYAQPLSQRRANRPRLLRAVRQAMAAAPGARLSMDSAATEVDVAIDYEEQIHLGHAAADRIERRLHARGVVAVRSSVHINCWLGAFDKLRTTRAFVSREWGTPFATTERGYVYVGDSLNDAPMFEGFTHSVGVANVLAVLDRLSARPAYVTRAAEGLGFEELARRVLSQERR
jgi:HAD superfamily hydrolase (TIGR01484 family)